MALPESRLDGLVRLTRRERALLIVLERARSCVQFWDAKTTCLRNLASAIRGVDEAYETEEEQ